jgi:hypothetical protein
MRTAAAASRLTPWMVRMLEENVDREIEAWLRSLLIVMDGRIGRLPEDVVQEITASSKSKSPRTRR